jgi:glyoxylase-like metal-dependent hydrolase (beta-lactamase superfamily II)
MWLVVAIARAGEVRVVNVGTRFIRVFALDGEEGVILVDAHYPKEEEAILRRLERADIDPERVTALVVTHGHPDHAGSAGALADRLGIPVIAGAADQPYFEAGEAGLHPTGSRGRLMRPFVGKSFPPVTVDVPVFDALDLSVYGVSATARVVGGHTPGSLIVDLGDGRALVGDLIRAHLFRVRRPTLHFFHDDLAGAHAALGQLLDEGVTSVLPAHGADMTAEDVRWWLTERAPRHAGVQRPRRTEGVVAEGAGAR